MSRKNLYLSTLCISLMSFFSNAQEGTVTINQDQRITQLLDLRKEVNKDETDSRRYKIQIYSGNRNGAKNSQKDFTEAFTQWRPVMHYEEPNFKVWVGNFNTRLEADRALKKVKYKFPAAFIFKPKKKK
ncbi:MAG: SPOR domain-containing protein [Jejuia sp.]